MTNVRIETILDNILVDLDHDSKLILIEEIMDTISNYDYTGTLTDHIIEYLNNNNNELVDRVSDEELVKSLLLRVRYGDSDIIDDPKLDEIYSWINKYRLEDNE